MKPSNLSIYHLGLSGLAVSGRPYVAAYVRPRVEAQFLFLSLLCNVRTNNRHTPRLAMATEEARAGAEDGLGDNAVDAPDDLASLASLDNASVMSGVQRRFEQDKIYTRINTLSLC